LSNAKTQQEKKSCGKTEQHINGKISYIPAMHPNTLKSDLEKYFNGEEV